MNKSQIGFWAGKIWQLLSNNAHWSYAELKRKSGLGDVELGAALGWLAKEDKVVFTDNKEKDDLIIYLYSCHNFFG